MWTVHKPRWLDVFTDGSLEVVVVATEINTKPKTNSQERVGKVTLTLGFVKMQSLPFQNILSHHLFQCWPSIRPSFRSSAAQPEPPPQTRIFLSRRPLSTMFSLVHPAAPWLNLISRNSYNHLLESLHAKAQGRTGAEAPLCAHGRR